ncbi:hypothetical protein [Streptomyces youssoufiensis]
MSLAAEAVPATLMVITAAAAMAVNFVRSMCFPLGASSRQALGRHDPYKLANWRDVINEVVNPMNGTI